MPNNAIVMINANMDADAARKVEGLEAKVRASMLAVIKGDWMAADDDDLFRSGVGGAMIAVGEGTPKYAQLTASMKALQKFSAFLTANRAGLTVSIIDALKKEDGEPETLPLTQWFREAKKEADA